MRYSLEREGIILPGRLAVPDQVGPSRVESQCSLGLEPADVSVVPPGQREGYTHSYSASTYSCWWSWMAGSTRWSGGWVGSRVTRPALSEERNNRGEMERYEQTHLAPG